MEEKITREIIQLGTLGDSGVGKTNLSTVYVDNKFSQEFISTIGFNCLIKNIKIKINDIEKNIKVKIWDTAGQEKFKSISVQYIKNCLGILLVYSITQQESLKNIENWMKEVNEKKNVENIPLILIGNKCDLENERTVSKEEGEKLANKYHMKFFECSAKNGINVNEAFQYLIDEIVKIYKNEFLNEEDNNIKENKQKDNNNKKKNEGCCGKKKNMKENEKQLNIKK